MNSTSKLNYVLNYDRFLYFNDLFKLYLLDMNNGEINCKYDSSKYNNIIPDIKELRYYVEEE